MKNIIGIYQDDTSIRKVLTCGNRGVYLTIILQFIIQGVAVYSSYAKGNISVGSSLVYVDVGLYTHEYSSMDDVFVEFQNDTQVRGKVTDESGEPLPGASIALEGTTMGTVTDLDGNYTINAPVGGTLIFSYIGFDPVRVKVDNRVQIDVTLKPELSSLDEVVVVGFGTVKKRDLTGAVSSLNADDVLSRPMSNLGDALQGQIAGVQIVQGSGRPGAGPSIQVRGLNSISAGQLPLLVIDGVPQANMADLGVIDPMVIESIEVLKDASASAIYGSRGGAGVVLVTTKRAKSGSSNFTVNHTTSVQQLPRRVPMMNAQQYMESVMTAAQNAWVVRRGGDPNAPNTVAARGHIRYTWPQEWDDPNVRASWPDTDWQDAIFRNAPMHKINLTGSGATETLTYYFAGSYTDQDGLVDNDHNHKMVHLNAKIENRFSKWFKAGMNINNRLTYVRNDPEDWSIVQHGIEFPPIFPLITEQGYAGGPLTIINDSRYPSTTPAMSNFEGLYFNTASNPYAHMRDIKRSENNFVQGNIWGELTLMEGLNFRSSFTYNQEWGRSSFFTTVDNNLPENFRRAGNMARNMTRNDGWYFENLLTYNKVFGDHSLNFTGGYIAERRNRFGFNAARRDYENDITPFLSQGRDVTVANDFEMTTTFLSSLARVNYGLKDKYLLTATIRQDGSSRFGTDYKFGYFPSVGAGWIVSDEDFMKGTSFLEFFKLRASYGLVGNDNFSDYLWVPSLGQGFAPIGGQMTAFFQKAALPNPELRWERTGQFNVGFDVELFNNRVNLVADFYNSRTADLLLNLPISSLTGFTSLMQNTGTVENKGMELALTTRNTVGKVAWTTNTNFSLNRGKVLDLGGEEYLIPAQSFGLQVRTYVGQPLFQFFGYDYLGTYRDRAHIDATPSFPGAEPGDARYRDVDGDGVITTEDRTLIGNAQPDFIWSMNNRVTWKGFDLSVLVVSVIGGEKVNLMRRRSVWFHGGRNFLDFMADAWTPENPDSYYYKLSTDLTGMNNQPSSYWIESATYVKLKDITLGYNLPRNFANRIGLATARVFFNGNNLFSWDNFIGYDPEQGGSGNNHIRRGFTHTEYPIPRVYSLGVNVSF
jgi:TonB-dependent starch-binding outer membrane protein SusC